MDLSIPIFSDISDAEEESKDDITNIMDSNDSKIVAINNRKKRKISNIPKACAVCETPAQYSHYGVLSCFACKIFFRRMVLSESKNKCKYEPSCNIFGVNICKSCRFDKCLFVGMNPRAIQFPNSAKAIEVVDYLTKRKLILEGKYFHISKARPTFVNSTYCNVIESLLHVESKIHQLRESEFNPTFYFNNIYEILQKPCELSNAHKYEKPKNWPINMDFLGENYDYIAHELNIFSKRCNRNWVVIDIVLVIEAAKTMPIFYRLNLEDKIRLLERIAMVNTKLMEYFYASQHHLNALVYPDGFIPIKLITKSPVAREASKIEYLVFCQNPDSIGRVNLSLTEYVLLKAIIYCYSAIPDISEQGKILLTEQREAYARLLLRYLQAHIGEESGAKRYLELLSIIPRLFHFTYNTRQIWMQMELIRQNHYNFTESLSKLVDKILLK